MFLKNLPKSININETNYPVRTDFRTWMEVESILKDNNVPDQFKLTAIYMCCDLFYENEKIANENIDAIFDSIFSFWRMYKPINPKAKIPNNIPYKYDVDFDLIVAAFRQQYGIDLYTAEMHWFEFKALFDGLNSNTLFKKIVEYRTMDLSKVPKTQKKEYAEIQDFYKIREEVVNERTPQEIERELLAKVGG